MVAAACFAGNPVALGDDIPDVVRTILVVGLFLAEGGEVVDDVANHHLLAVQATDAGAAASLGHFLDLFRSAVDLVQIKCRTLLRLTGIRPPGARGIRHHAAQLPVDGLGGIRQQDRVAVALAHLASVQSRQSPGLREQHLRFGEHRTVKAVEPPDDLPGQLHVRRLIRPHGNPVSLVHDDVGRLQHRIAEKTVGGQVPLAELPQLFLVGRVPFQPGNRRQHGQQVDGARHAP